MHSRNLFLATLVSLSFGCATVDDTSTSGEDVIVSSQAISTSDKDIDLIVSEFTGADKLIRSVEVYFNTGSSEIPEHYLPLINKIKMALAHDPDLKLYIQGHADERGDKSLNIKLSKERAVAIVKKMELSKETYKRISIDFFGEDKPRCDVVSSEGLTCNRRVDIFLVK